MRRGLSGRLWLIVPLALAAVMSVRAQETAVTLDPEKSAVSFTLAASFHTVHGSFRVKSGALRFNSASGAAGGLIVVDATSGETGNKKRDRNMHHDVLKSATYTEVTFMLTHVTGKLQPQGESKVQVDGTLKILGTEHPITLPFDIQITGIDLHAATQFAIPYVQWGLKNPSNAFLHVADNVQMSIAAVGKISPAEAH